MPGVIESEGIGVSRVICSWQGMAIVGHGVLVSYHSFDQLANRPSLSRQPIYYLNITTPAPNPTARIVVAISKVPREKRHRNCGIHTAIPVAAVNITAIQ